MSKKRAIDPGLAYLQEIGFDRIRGPYGLFNRLTTVFGKSKAEQLWDRRLEIPDGSEEFYEFKNSDPEISRCFSEAYDGDIIRKACNYIDSHKEYFGKTILEVGCESGYMTRFLAKTFPEAKIVSIDRSKSAIEMAKQKLEKLGISNVELRHASLEEIDDQYDTVFCMRTLQENWDSARVPFNGEPLMAQIFGYSELTEDYTGLLVSRLNEHGNLCVFERIGHDVLMCGWMMCLSEFKCSPDLSTYVENKCEEGNDTNTFQSFICHNGVDTDPEKILQTWFEDIYVSPAGKDKLTGLNALGYLFDNAGELIRGIRIFNDEGEQVGRFAAFYDKDDSSAVYYLHAPGGGEIQLFFFEEGVKEEILNNINSVIEENEKIGLHYEEIDPKDEYLEGRAKTQANN